MFFRCEDSDFIRREFGSIVLLFVVIVAQSVALNVSAGPAFVITSLLSILLMVGFLWRYRSDYSTRPVFFCWLAFLGFVSFARARSQLPSPDSLRAFAGYEYAEGISADSCSPYRLARSRCGTLIQTSGRVERDSRLNYRGEHWVRLTAETAGGRASRMELRFPFLPWKDRLLLAGEHVSFDANVVSTLSAVNGTALSHAEQRLATLYRNGVVAWGYVNAYSMMTNKTNPSPRVAFIEKLFKSHERRDALALVVASTLGEAQLLSRHMRDIFRETGTSHLIVVSGFHVGLAYLIGGFCFRLCSRALGLRYGPVIRARAEILVGLLFVLCFSCSVRFSMPVLRALLFIVLFAYCQWDGRRYPGLECICLVFVAANLIFPGAFLDPSFQLTCAAVLGLERSQRLACSGAVGAGGRSVDKFLATHRLKARDNVVVWRPMKLALLRCVVVFAFTSPVVLYWFGTFQPTSVIWNFLLSGIFTIVVVVAGIVGLVVSLIAPRVGEILLGPVLVCVDWLIWVVASVSASPLNWSLEFDRQGSSFGVFFCLTMLVALAVLALGGLQQGRYPRSFHAAEDAIPS